MLEPHTKDYNMEVLEEEMSYLLRLLDQIDNDIYQEIIHTYYDVLEKNPSDNFSERVLNFFKKNLESNPVTTTNILSFFQNNLSPADKKLDAIQQMYIDVLKNTVLDKNNAEPLISFLSLIRFESNFISDTVYDILYKISDDSLKQKRKEVYISLVAHDRPDLIKIFSDSINDRENKKEFKLTPESMIQMCYMENQHWILKAVQVYKQQLLDMRNVTFKINNFTRQILILVLLDIINNQDNYDFPSVIIQLNNIFSLLNSYTAYDNQLAFYITEIYRELKIIKFCIENKCKLLSMSVFNQVLIQSGLSVVSQLCRLSRIDRYKVTRLLTSNNQFLDKLKCLSGEETYPTKSCWDIIAYNSYCALTSIIDLIVIKDNQSQANQTDVLNEVTHFINQCPERNRLEIIENIYACLFLRYEYFSCEDHNQGPTWGAHSDCSYFDMRKNSKAANNSRYSYSGFMCNAELTQIILNMLRDCLHSIENSHSFTGETLDRLESLIKVVDHSLWKLHLVLCLSPERDMAPPRLCADYEDVIMSSGDDEYEDTQHIKSRRRPRGKRKSNNVKSDSDQLMGSSAISSGSEVMSTSSNVEFVSLMLATPNSLVALALHHNNFNRANQIIQMFDLGDADIAIEIKFTEQLKQLVNKIKNINTYGTSVKHPIKELSSFSVLSTEITSMVEGFLSTNRTPNSHEVVELARRYPHLQLYDHKNTHLINVIDILLSTGIKRDVTYGLINIVERKLTEVNDIINDVTTKRTNYVQFIKDLISVMFEIFAIENTYPDNVCDVINDCKIPLKHKDFVKMNQHSKELEKNCAEFFKIMNMNREGDDDNALLQKYHQIYLNVVSIADKDICNVAESYGLKKSRIHYLRTCYIYSKNISNLENDNERSTTDSINETTYFSVLDRHLHTLIGELIFDRNVSISSLEPVCKKLNINLIHKLVLNFCPQIPIVNRKNSSDEHVFNTLLQVVYECQNKEEELFVEPTVELACLSKPPDTQSMTYILVHNWILANILRKLHLEPVEQNLQSSIDSRTKVLNNYMDLKRFDYLKCLFSGNKYLAALFHTVDLDALFTFFPELIKTGKLLKCLHIIDALSEEQLLKSANLKNLRDLILFKLAIHPSIHDNWKYSQHLKCSELKVDLVLNHLNCWSVHGAMAVLNSVRYLLEQEPEEGLYTKCSDWLKKLPVYYEISKIISKTSWYDMYEKSMECPEEIIEILMDSQQFKLCLQWADLHDVSSNMKNLIITNLIRQLFEYTTQTTPDYIQELLNRLPTGQAMELLQENISKIRNIEILDVVVKYVIQNAADWKMFENIRIGLLIMKEIEPKLRVLFWDIINKPLLMIEQLLMNAKIEKLTAILNKINPHLKIDPNGDNLYYNMKTIHTAVISTNAVDALLRVYAEKALDMQNPRHFKPPSPKQEEVLLQSLDSINLDNSSGPFIMPEQVPSKEQWVKNESVDCCMVCKIATFSLIIRRHHCRRCGRVVCHVCSRNRMTVPTYPEGVKFRVCDDCFKQTQKKTTQVNINPNALMSSHSDSLGSGLTYMDWYLSGNSRKNQEVRNEFSYEFTPNVNLCLTIMKLHSNNLDYPKFLLDRSEEIWTAISGTKSIDAAAARLLVRARRWLLLAAAELYSRPHQHSDTNPCNICRITEAGAAHASRCLAHAAAEASLVQYHNLLPPQAALPGHFVRHLLEAEKWEPALEIATKSGLPRQSVLAAWGKACLKAGCFKTARDKFAHCFKNSVVSNFLPNLTEEEECDYGREPSEMRQSVSSRVRRDRSISLSSVQSESIRPRTNPPLLNEIISILEDISYPVNPQILAKAENIRSTNDKLASTNINKKRIPLTEPALNIMHALASINKIKNGDFSDFCTASQTQKKTINILRRTITHNEAAKNDCHRLDSFFFKECVYYLSNYGSHMGNIQFYMMHSNLSETLKYCYDNMVEKDVFTECVYMECLRLDRVNELVKVMYELDSTLDMWSEYLTSTCCWLENNNRLDALYSLQVVSNQQARAAATAARMYARPVSAGTPVMSVLKGREHHLTAAQAHLMQCVPCEASKISNRKSFNLQLDKARIDKHLTTISRQIELVRYLTQCESAGRLTNRMMRDVLPVNGNDGGNIENTREIPPLTLFGSQTDRMRLAGVCIVAGETVLEGFDLAYRIIKDSQLDCMKVLINVARYLILTDRLTDIKELCEKVRELLGNSMSDQILSVSVSGVVTSFESRGRLYDEAAELLIADIRSITTKISCYIECKILTEAYILAAEHSRTNELKKIMREAERLGHENVRNACMKRLNTLRSEH